jgi:serine/threonine protein kinase
MQYILIGTPLYHVYTRFGSLWTSVASHLNRALTPVPRMSRISDLVRDSKLFTEFTSECTTHTFFGSTLVPGKKRARRQRREERWTKSKRLGHGSFGVVWLEECVTGRNGRLRAVKEIRKETVGFQEEEYNRELEAIAKFSHARVWLLSIFDDCRLGWANATPV